jgi:hypothetical protein
VRNEVPKFAAFGINSFRFGIGRTENFPDVETSADEMDALAGMLSSFDEAGVEPMLIGGADLKPVVTPEDMTWNHHFVPDRRDSFYHFNFNSKRIRDRWSIGVEQWAPVVDDAANVPIVQLANEPFFDLSNDPRVGYNPAEIGCSSEAWREQIRRFYSDSEWRGALDEWVENSLEEYNARKVNRYWVDGDPGTLVGSWDSIDDARFHDESMEGLTFVDFLKERHGDLETLNETWFGDDTDRYYSSWADVFPPVPTETGVATGRDLGAVPDQWTNTGESVRPTVEDIPAFVEWNEVHGRIVSDCFSQFRDDVEAAGLEDTLVNTNAVMGHYINDFGFAASICGCYPWTTMDGLGAHGIDYYSIAYMQAYVASLRDADVNRDQPDRPVWVHEIRFGGDRNMNGPHIAMFNFAHGVDGLEFFDHDRFLFPRDSVGLAKLMDAMAEEQLQFDSEPVTDGVAALYSMDSLWLADAETGGGRPYMVNFQSAVTTLDRMQVLYSVYNDRQLEPNVPDDVSVLMAPGARAMTDETLESIRIFVEDGGTLITTPNFAAVTRYGRSRADDDRQWIRNHDDVVVLEGEDLDTWLENWQRGEYGMQRPLGWAEKDLPAVADEIEPVVREAAPRTVRYLDSDGNMDARKTGARRSDDGTTYVFVDPWAEDVTLAVPGEFSGAQNLYRDEDVSLEMADGEGRVTLESGPAIVRFEP